MTKEKYQIVIAPDPVLRQKAAPVKEVDAAVVQLMEDMLAIMYEAPGIGLAAPQIGLSKRVIVMDCGIEDEEDCDHHGCDHAHLKPNPLAMANPEITWTSDETSVTEEGCLSLPGQTADVTRPAKVTVRYLDQQGNEQELTADGLLATCIQHEIDHLDGVLFVDHLSRLKRDMIMKKMKKIKAANKL